MNNKKIDRQILVPAVDRALDILEYLANKNGLSTIKDISSNLSIPNASAYRIVKVLCDRGYIDEDSTQGYYKPGFKILYLSNLITKQLDLSDIAKPIMRTLADETGQTTQLGLLHNYGVMYIEQILPLKPVSIIAQLRQTIPINISASGKILVAYLSNVEQENFLKKIKLEPKTENTITDMNRLKEQLVEIKKNGYAIDNEEYARGIGCLAVPIFDYTQTVVASLGITGHIDAYKDKDNLDRLINSLKSSAKKISSQIGYEI